MKLKSIAILATLPILAACLQNAPLKGPPITVSTKANSGASSRILGYTEPVIRTRQAPTAEQDPNSAPNGSGELPQKRQKIEISGATCKLDSAEFSAEFVTPATLRIPILKGKPTPIRLTCTSPGYANSYRFNSTLEGVIVAGPSIAGLVAAAVTAGVAATNDKWSFGANDIAVWIPLEPTSTQ